MAYRVIPEDLQLEILARLPIKSIIRFKSVCKRWHFLVGTSFFITRFNDFFKSRPSKLLCVGKDPTIKRCVLSSLDHEPSRLVEEIEFPPFLDDEWVFNEYHREMYVDSKGIPFIDDGLESLGVDYRDISDESPYADRFTLTDKSIEIMGPVNGIYCLYCLNHVFRVDMGGSLILWNPATRSYKYIMPPITFPFSMKYENMYFNTVDNSLERTPQSLHIGFGYDESINDYKVVIICFWYMEYSYLPDERWHVRVYNNSTKTQSTISYIKYRERYGELAFPYVDSRPEFCNGYINGACHWLCLKRDVSFVEVSEYGVLAFDMKNETLTYMSGPSTLMGPIPLHANDLSVRRSVWAFRETIVMVATELQRENVDVWIMKEYGVKDSWNLLCSIGVGPIVDSFAVVGITNGERIFFGDDKGKLISYYFEEDDVVEHDEPLGYPYSGRVAVLDFEENLEFVQPKERPH